ncbi:glycosyltransferase family 1 protein [Tardiphaga sp. 804_B3_N1_9]|uniref:glycosyltransferase family 1 protein n=1 Tax=Tardiphaga sp. 804_B3_N1_9 TaxID=3240786 RepID=UPI001828651D|nr:glycosyltransferase family 1 protein [Tardiphaga robiniae]
MSATAESPNRTRPRILELGSWHYCKDIYPEETDVLWTGERPIPRGRAAKGFADCTPWRFIKAMREARRGAYDLIIVYMPLRPAWHPRYWLRAFFRQPLRPLSAMTRVFGVSWLRFVKPPVPIAVLDMNDAFIVGSHNFFLLDKATAAFKRELPVDRWHILCHSAHPALPTRRIRRNRRWNERLAKIRPISLPATRIDTDSEPPEKTSDVFFVGEVAENSWVRRVGLSELEALRSKGLKVDIPHERLPHDEFLRRLSSAWLAWSPSGYSWECYRTAEAAQCLTVPVLNYPTVERHAPVREHEHVLLYDVTPGSLSAVIERGLSNKPRLRQMALGLREHVRKYHLQDAMVDYVIDETLRADGRTA